ncbi:phosphate ABC transporter, permease protein PstA [Izhakiella australiensis]|uniref:Phosphate transport system permease protein PstA n=1 Tax=Izhakiella australiensis TaxID=1926881 RepID=A0A1S8YJV4_9GAMM|nr:phosphate ABC transporter permease PstA [Izhakiella australiensis]OON39006.1 phosphate ABC transporter, permease protein PstA [Izhakiella australiensis]
MTPERYNERWRWLTAGAVSLSLLAFLLLIGLLLWQGMRYFWPQPLILFSVQQPHQAAQPLLAEVISRQSPGTAQGAETTPQRLLVKTGNRDFAAPDFRTLLSSQIRAQSRPADAIAVLRRDQGMAYGWFAGLEENQQALLASNMDNVFHQRLQQVRLWQRQASHLRQVTLVEITKQLQTLAQQQKFDAAAGHDLQQESIIEANRAEAQRQFHEVSQQLAALERQIDSDRLVMRDAQGALHRLPLADIVDAWYPNRMNFAQKLQQAASRMIGFVSDTAPTSPEEGGIFPAIFGTVLMVMLMSVVVMPLGVVAAVWLHEYAGNGLLTRLVRIAVVNLAGVPSIVYGVFGLGFFVWLIGGSLDRLLFIDRLPAPTFGTPGLLWASLTLALLTLPVVIVATEEGLSRIPRSLRQGALALGATSAEALWQVTLPLAVPAMLTGLIMAIARAAGEVAPLMLVGVVKMVPELPVDGVFPYLHLDRKFMHLGYQIYELAFQNPNSQSDRPLLFATALLLVVIILLLNLLAMILRHRLRERYRTLLH